MCLLCSVHHPGEIACNGVVFPQFAVLVSGSLILHADKDILTAVVEHEPVSVPVTGIVLPGRHHLPDAVIGLGVDLFQRPLADHNIRSVHRVEVARNRLGDAGAVILL